MKPLVLVLLGSVLGAASGSAQAAEFVPIPSQTCSGFGGAPALATCYGQDLVYGGGERGKLAVIACILHRLQEWKLKQIECLEEALATRQRVVIWPGGALRIVRLAMQPVDTLRKEAEKLACDWRFSLETAAFRDLYFRPLKLCRDGFRALWGGHELFPDADVHNLYEWTSTLTHNLVQDRTIHDHGISGELPEETWRRIGAEGAEQIGGIYTSIGEANRFEAQMLADRLRVDANSIQLQAQTILVAQQARDYRLLKARYGRALSMYLVARVAGRDGEVP